MVAQSSLSYHIEKPFYFTELIVIVARLPAVTDLLEPA